jgi:type II secretory pathway component GspD/PulD (secretin)
VEQLVGSLDSNTAPKQVEVTVKFIEIADENLEELGFDWLLPLPGRGDGS